MPDIFVFTKSGLQSSLIFVILPTGIAILCTHIFNFGSQGDT